MTFGDFNQSPRCNYDIAYTLTLIEQTEENGVDVSFDLAKEGATEFATLDTVNRVVSFEPIDEAYAGKTFAVFIRANVAVTEGF